MQPIEERLRKWAISTDAAPASDLMDEAADEIERLRGLTAGHSAEGFDDLLVRLRKIEHGDGHSGWVVQWYRNPDGREDAGVIESLCRELQILRENPR